MKAVILCGGEGTRIRDVNEVIPKPMLPIGGKPILWHIMKIYASHGVKEFVLCLGYKGWLIREFFLNYMAMTSDFTIQLDHRREIEFHGDAGESDWRVTLADTGEDTMTGGRISRIRKYVEGEGAFCVSYGDGVGDINISALLEQHRRSGLAATLTGVRVAGRFGELEGRDGQVTVFNEKPAVTAGRINGGFMVFDSSRIWDYFEDNPRIALEREPLARLVAARQLGVYEHDGFWQCMDTLREYNQLNDLWAKGSAPWKLW